MSLVPLGKKNAPARRRGWLSRLGGGGLTLGQVPEISEGERRELDLSAMQTGDFSQAAELFVSAFLLRRAPGQDISAADAAASATPLMAAAPMAVAAYGAADTDLAEFAVVVARATGRKARWNEHFLTKGAGRSILPSGYKVLRARTIPIPRAIMRELVGHPGDARELFAASAVIRPIAGLMPRKPEIALTWACGTNAAAVVDRWSAAPQGLAGLAAKGERAVLITTLRVPRDHMTEAMRFRPIA